MTMPQGSTEEPDVMLIGQQSVPVHVASSAMRPGKPIGTEFGQTRTVVVNSTVGPNSVTPGAQRILNRSLRRYEARLSVISGGQVLVNNPTPSQPAVPATGVAQENNNSYPVQVVISANGATITNVSVNGVTVGTSAGTYVVPADGSISIAYSVAVPTWVWSNANGTSGLQAQPATDGAIFGAPSLIQSGAAAAIGSLGGFLPIGKDLVWKSQAELWVCYPASNVGPVFVTVHDFQWASDPESFRENQ